jgi:hypothetical protein
MAGLGKYASPLGKNYPASFPALRGPSSFHVPSRAALFLKPEF